MAVQTTTVATAYPAQGVGALPLLGFLAQHDTDKNGLLSKQELAKAALATQDQAQFNVLYLMLAGGSDGAGLYPDENNDGQLSVLELAGLAAKAGDTGSISDDDFTAGFGNRATPIEVTMEAARSTLTAIANGQTQSPGYPGNNSNMLNLFTMLIQMIMQIFQQFLPRA